MDLKSARFLKGNIRQIELARLSGVTQSRISEAEQGLRDLREIEKEAIERVLDCPIDWPVIRIRKGVNTR